VNTKKNVHKNWTLGFLKYNKKRVNIKYILILFGPAHRTVVKIKKLKFQIYFLTGFRRNFKYIFSWLYIFQANKKR